MPEIFENTGRYLVPGTCTTAGTVYINIIYIYMMIHVVVNASGCGYLHVVNASGCGYLCTNF